MIEAQTALSALSKLKNYAIHFSIVMGFLIFLPPSLLDKFGMSDFVLEYKLYISIILMFSMAQVIVSIGNKIKLIYQARNESKRKINFEIEEENKAKKTKLDAILNLTNMEKEILLKCVSEGKKEISNDDTDCILSLQAYGIIVMPSQFSHDFNFTYVIQPWVWNTIVENREEISKYKATE